MGHLFHEHLSEHCNIKHLCWCFGGQKKKKSLTEPKLFRILKLSLKAQSMKYGENWSKVTCNP